MSLALRMKKWILGVAKLTRIDQIKNEDMLVMFSHQDQDYRGITIPNATASLAALGFQVVDPDAETVPPITGDVDFLDAFDNPDFVIGVKDTIDFTDAFDDTAFMLSLCRHVLTAFRVENGNVSFPNGVDIATGEFTFTENGTLVTIPQTSGGTSGSPTVTLSPDVISFAHTVSGEVEYDFIVTTNIGFPYSVDWGDGSTIEEYASGTVASHTYAAIYNGDITFAVIPKDTLNAIFDLSD